MQSTSDKVRFLLENEYGFKKQRNGEFRGNNPFKHGSNSNGFVVTFKDGENGAYYNHAGTESGSLYELAKKLNIETPQNNRVQVDNTKTSYTDLNDYAKRHYATIETFQKANWQYEIVQNRPALTWEVATGRRVRFIDEKGGFMWIGDNSGNCWYGLNRAIQMAYERAFPLIICNGEPSTVVAQSYGIPALCGTGGEGAISDDMKRELDAKWNGEIIIALDCDDKGRDASKRIQAFLGRGIVIDMMLSEKGDLADFCGLHTDSAMKSLRNLAQQNQEKNELDNVDIIEFVSSKSLLSDFDKFMYESPELFGRTIRMPFASLRQAGGFANIITTKKVWFIGNKSGDGKTILSETLCDEFNSMGYNTFYIGDEWSPMELNARMIQRAYSGDNPVTYEQFLRYANGEFQFHPSQETGIAYSIRTIRERSGETFYMNVNTSLVNEKPEKSVVFLEDILKSAGNKIRDLRANGKQVDVLIIDYLSLYETYGSANNLEEYKAGVFKAYCKSLDVFGITTVQVKKEAEDRVTDRGGMLNQHDLYWIRPDKANLITTMNRVYVPKFVREHGLSPQKAIQPLLDENGQAEPTPNFAMLIVKNSVGQPFYSAYFHMDYKRLRVVEGLHPDYIYHAAYRYPVHRKYYSETTKIPF